MRTVGRDRSRTGLAQAVVALRHRNFALFWSGALISNIGTWMQNVTIPYVLLYVMHTSAIWVGLATVTMITPGVILSPYAGSFADRFPRRTVILVSQVLQSMLALGMWAGWVAGVRSPGYYLAFVASIGTANALNMPAWQAFVSELVPREDLLNAVTLNAAQFNGARAFGPALSGLVLARFGASWAFLLNAISFATVVVALLAVRAPTTRPKVRHDAAFREYADGLRFTRRHPELASPVLLAAMLGLTTLPVSQVAAIMAKKVFDLDASRYGILLGAYGGGAVLGAVLLGVIGSWVTRSRLVLAGVAGFAAGLAVLATAPSFLVAVVGLAMCGVCFITTFAIMNTTVQLHVPEHLRGRIMAIYVMGFSATFPLGSLIQSWLAGRYGARPIVMGAAIVTALLTVVLLAKPAWLTAMDGTGAQIVMDDEPVDRRRARGGGGDDRAAAEPAAEPLTAGPAPR